MQGVSGRSSAGSGVGPSGIGGGTSLQPSSEPPEQVVIKNLTGKRIAIAAVPPRDDGKLIIPPFGQRTIPKSERDLYDHASWTRQTLVTVEDLSSTGPSGSPLLSSCPILAGYSLLAALGFLTLAWTQSTYKGTYLLLAGIAAVITVMSLLAAWRYGRHTGETWGRMGRSLNIFLVVLIGGGLPITAITFVRRYYWDQTQREVFGFTGHVLMVVLAAASVLPAALYFWFHRQKMPVLRENFLRDIVRLDPNVQTITDAQTSYDGLIDDVYGPTPGAARSTRTGHATTGTWGGLPVLIVTLLFATLWTWALVGETEHREDLIVLDRQAAALTAASAAGTEVEDIDQSIADFMAAVPGYQEVPPDTSSLLTPSADVVSYAFLGSYFFALNMLFRRYTRSDLSPKAYTHICVRTVTAIVVAWAVSTAPFLQNDSGKPTWIMLFLAFMIGIVPETGTAVIQDVLRGSKRIGKQVPSLQEEHPLAKLAGISLYDRSQLLEVGIENVESLAHNNLVDLMLWTRIPTSRLVDFVDQGILYLHVRGPVHLVPQDEEMAEKVDEDGARDLLTRHGIRTATDLERAYDLADDKPAFLRLLDAPGATVQRLRVILDALEDDEWMVYLRNWRSQNLVSEPLSSVDDFVTAASRGVRPQRLAAATNGSTEPPGAAGANGQGIGPAASPVG